MTTSNAVNVGTVPNGIVYASAAGVLSQIATAIDGLLVTSHVGVPSILAGPGTTGNILQSNAALPPSFSTATYPSVATGTGTILRADGTNWVETTATYPNTTTINRILFSSANNVISEISTANSGVLVTDGTGVPSIQVGQIPGTATNDSASSGNIGEYVSSIIALGSAVSFTNNVPRNITSISLTAGDWNLWGNVFFNNSVSTGSIAFLCWTSTTSASVPDQSLYNQISVNGGLQGSGINTPFIRLSLAVPTTVYLSARANFGSGTCTGCGGIYARRAR